MRKGNTALKEKLDEVLSPMTEQDFNDLMAQGNCRSADCFCISSGFAGKERNMEKLLQLGNDVAKLWETYGTTYLYGMRDTLILALVATVIGCIIGLVCGVFEHHSL